MDKPSLPPITDFYTKTHTDRLNILWVAAVDTWNKLTEIELDTRKHHELLITGNGGLPIPERLRTVEDYVKNMKYWARFIFGAIIIQTIAFLFGIVIAVARFLPVLERLAKQP